jgi:hypothetical protein
MPIWQHYQVSLYFATSLYSFEVTPQDIELKCEKDGGIELINWLAASGFDSWYHTEFHAAVAKMQLIK